MIERVQNNKFSTDYSGFLQDILTKIQQTRYKMLMSVSKQTLLLPDFDTLKYVILQYTDFHYFINFRTPKWVSQLKKSVYLHHVCAQEK